MTSKETVCGKIKGVKKFEDDFIYIDNKFKIENKDQTIDWTLILPKKSLLKLDTDIKFAAEKIKNILSIEVEELTAKKASVISSDIKDDKDGTDFKNYKIYDLNLICEKENIAIYIALKDK